MSGDVKLTPIWPEGERHYQVYLDGRLIGEVWLEGYRQWRGSHRGRALHSGVMHGPRDNHQPAFVGSRREAVECVVQAEERCT